ncbi:unnamed protein product [Schistosoma curassoni]|uniref:Endo/exonuclease/phosphatase domain-containing protein n=1 Tax=Schistosoma curassoni TaxID=6186 RepID=A0A183KDU0_9TREM|nr:unnamed protein product [Schistosoma curassoni]
MSVIRCYAPNNDSNDDNKDQFCGSLQSIIEMCPRKDLTIVMGDLSVKVGTDNAGSPLGLLDIKAAHTDLLIDVTPPTIEGIRMSIRQIKSAKVTGHDNITAEALKPDIEVTANMLHTPFRKIWEEEQVPTDWKEGYLIKMPKKGDLSKCENWATEASHYLR